MTIQPHHVQIDRDQAKELYRAYKAHVHYSEPIDREIQRTYQLVAQGRVVIKVIDSLKAAGVDDKGLPKLALARADVTEVFFRGDERGGGRFSLDQWPRGSWSEALAKNWRRNFMIPAGTFPDRQRGASGRARLPIIPIHLRPKRGLANYHVLWEAEWSPLPPVDPLLLRRIGRSDLWLVVAAWDLTEVERAALSTRMNG